MTTLVSIAVVAVICAGVFYIAAKSQAAPAKPVGYEINGDGRYAFEIVGESHYQDALDEIAGGKVEGGSHELNVMATLGTMNDNPHDPMAVMVAIDGKCVGYLSRANARWLRGQFPPAEMVIWIVKAKIVGGWISKHGEGHYGVKLDIPVPEQREENP